MALSRNSRLVLLTLALLALAGMIVDVALSQAYHQAMLIHAITTCSSGCAENQTLLLPSLFGLHFGQIQWIVFATQFTFAVVLLRKYTKKLEQAQRLLLLLHAGILLLLFGGYLHKFTGTEGYVITTTSIALVSAALMLFLKKKRNKNPHP